MLIVLYKVCKVTPCSKEELLEKYYGIKFYLKFFSLYFFFKTNRITSKARQLHYTRKRGVFCTDCNESGAHLVCTALTELGETLRIFLLGHEGLLFVCFPEQVVDGGAI